MKNDPWLPRLLVLCLTVVCVTSMLTAIQFKALQGETPVWVVGIASAAAGSLGTLVGMSIRRNGNGSDGNHPH